MTTPKTTQPTRWYLFTGGGGTHRSRQDHRGDRCSGVDQGDQQWISKPWVARQLDSDTSWDQVTEDAVNQFTGEGVKP